VALGYIETTGNDSGFVNKHKRQSQMYFLICESCYWCASTSYLYFIKDEAIGKHFRLCTLECRILQKQHAYVYSV